MGQYCYLINKNERIRVEAYKLSGGGEDSFSIEQEKHLVIFLDYCRTRNLLIECVHESWFEREANYLEDDWEPFKELSNDR